MRNLLLVLSFLLVSCVVQTPKKATNSRIINQNSTTTNSTNNNNNNSNSNTNTNTGSGSGMTAGEMYFTQTLVPQMQSSCVACHTEPFNNPAIPAPLSIYDYASMTLKLADGTSSTNNNLIQKVQGQVAHGGGNQCASNNLICMSIQTWYDQEFSSTTSGNTGSGSVTGVDLDAAVYDVSSTGRILGWAADKNNTATAVSVSIYVDGPKGAGVFLQTVSANMAGFNGGYSGLHAFSYDIPNQYRDGSARQFYLYAEHDNSDFLLAGSPFSFTGFTPTAEGFAYYDSTLKPILINRCSSCHAINYDAHYANLSDPASGQGGSRTNNELINMPAGSHNGQNHPGGNICGSKDNSPCAEIANWWDLEFGN